MRTIHEIRFPQYVEDIVSERRTLFHMPVVGTDTVCICSGDQSDPDYCRTRSCGAHAPDQSWAVGDELRLLAVPNSPRCKIGVLIGVRQVPLLTELNACLAKLNASDRAEYLARWDVLHPELPSASDPMVWRIEFRYGAGGDSKDPPEWSLAS